jgi:hypothetical protein
VTTGGSHAAVAIHQAGLPALQHWLMLRPLPISAPVHGHRSGHRQPHDTPDLRPIIHTPMILAPRCLLRIPDQIRARDVVVMPDFAPAHAAEELFRPVRVDATASGIHLAMVDPGHVEAAMQIVPRCGFVGHQARLWGNAGSMKRVRRTLRPGHRWQRPARRAHA